MKTLLVAINSKYIHSNPAVRCLKEYAMAHHTKEIGEIAIGEYTINQQTEFIISKIAEQKPDVIGLSCYIWNYEYMKKISGSLRRILPNTVIFIGGPQVSYHCETALTECHADYCISGEGEEIVMQLLQDIAAGDPPKEAVLGHGYANNAVELGDIPFIYHDMGEYQNRIVYYETSRGCPFRCAYCLSSIKGREASVRYLPMERVKSDLDFFLTHEVRQVKFVDRTFNCDKARALEMIEYIKAHDNGITNFHFEVAAELLDDALITSLQGARPELFQLEIGVQSTNPPTLKAIRRITLPEKLSEIIPRLQKNHNIHLHLDLIAGLPHEDIDAFSRSFDFVYGLRPEQFQLGFLKVLAGSAMEEMAEEYGIIYNEYPPYEVLYTRDLPYDDVQRLKHIEAVLELYYNSGRFVRTMECLAKIFAKKSLRAFELYDRLGEFYYNNGYGDVSQSLQKLYDILHAFICEMQLDKETYAWFCDCIRFDMASHEKPRRDTDWLTVTHSKERNDRILALFDTPDFRAAHFADSAYEKMDSKQLLRLFDLQFFTRELDTGLPVSEYACFFHYQKRDLFGNAYSTRLENGSV